jgi:hypothetical protein
MSTDDPWEEQGGEELEAEIMRADRAFEADRHGVTLEEAREGLGLDEALARERPEGRTVDEFVAIEDDGALDVEDELVADGSVEMDEYASPEEAAISVRDDAPGATDHDDQHNN